MPVVALTHPQKARLHLHDIVGPFAFDRQLPAGGFVGPVGGRDAVAISDEGTKARIGNRITQIVEDLIARGDRLPGPRLEAVAEGEQVAI